MRKKRIVAMALAMSIFASTFGMLGAAAADAEPIEDTAGGSITVTVVPLESTTDAEPTQDPIAEEPEIVADSEEVPAAEEPTVTDGITPATEPTVEPTDTDPADTGAATMDTPTVLPAIISDATPAVVTDEPADSEGTDTKRPSQSDTVETLPGNKDDADKTPAEDDPYPESKDFEFVYDPETKHFHITFNIKEDAEGDQTIELSKVLEQVDGYGQAEFDNWKNSSGYQAALKRGQKKVRWTGDRFGGLEYVFDMETGEAHLYMEPGCTTVFDVSLSNGSKHTYVYKDNSFTVASPKLNGDTGVTGFDGQELPDRYAESVIQLGYNRYGETGCMEHLADLAAKEYYNDTRDWCSPSKVISGMQKYIDEHYNGSYEAYILEYFNSQSDADHQYSSIEELLSNNNEAVKDLSSTKTIGIDQNITLKNSTNYDNFYQNLFSFNVGSEDDMKEFLQKEGLTHGSWAYHGDGELTIGQYMADELNKTGKWAEANAYFNQLLKSGLSSDEATWAAFTMATNLDGYLTGNDYQNTAWSWYASMVLKQADGTLDLTKTDKDTGEVIKDSETSFYLWKYETTVDKETKEETTSTLYYTYVEPSTDKEGNEVPGYYGWAKYDPDKKNMTYTITTTDGKLNIDYALLENMVYYLQEAVAPDGYDIDTTVYIICNEDTYNQLKESGETITNVAAGTTSSAADLKHLGTIEGGKTLTVQFINKKTVTPTPDPDPTPVDPENPDNPVDPENPDNPPVQDETPDEPETPVTPENPSNPPVQDATAELPKTGTSGWMVSLLMTAGFALLAGGWFASRKQYAPKH